MSSDARHDRISQVFLQACEQPEADRRAFVEDACADDDDLRREVLDLLSHDEPTGLLDEGPGLDLAGLADAAPPADPDRVGDYEILDRLGVGGMGVVYRARQANPERLVALKVIRPGAVSERLIRRFEHEARILGRLTHPGVAQIYEAGAADTGAGLQPYFAMELVEGVRLTDWCEARGLGARERLALLAEVAEAVHHAHQKGVIHRDLKPANILVTPEGRTKILDFGVARVTDEDVQATTMRTDVGQLLGTIPYMSPEQVEGDPDAIDVRSDVYALGVIGYELLAGRLPHDVRRTAVADAVRRIRDEEPASLSSVSRVFRGDVDTIIHTALAKDRDRRYPSAEALATDIRRYLRDEPIVARPPSAAYQLSKFARRNRALVAAAVMIVLVLIGATIVAVDFAVDANAARDLAQREKQAAERALEASDSTVRFLERLLAGADPWVQTTGADTTIGEVLDRAAVWATSEFEGQPELEVHARLAIAESFKGLARYDEAAAQLDLALELIKQVEPPRPSMHRELRRKRAVVQAYLAQWDEAAEQLLALRAEQDQLAASPDPRGVDQQEIARVMSDLAWALRGAGRPDEAERIALDACDWIARAYGPDHEFFANVHNTLAGIYTARGDYAKARDAYDEVRRIFEIRHGADTPQVAALTNNVARLDQAIGNLDAAETGYRNAVARNEAVFGPHHPQTGDVLNNLAMLLYDLGRNRESEDYFLRSLEAYAESVGADSRTYGGTLNNYAFLLREEERWDEAIDAYQQFRRILVDHHPPGHWRFATVDLNLASCLAGLGRFDEALTLAADAAARLEAADTPDRYLILGPRTLERIETARAETAAPDAVDAP